MSLTLRSDGPGVNVEVKDGATPAPTAPRGSFSLAGLFASGPNLPVVVRSKAEARIVFGEPKDEYEAASCLYDAYSEYEAPFVGMRFVGDGATASSVSLPNRRAHVSQPMTAVTPVGQTFYELDAGNEGRWAGSRTVLPLPFANAAALASAITGTNTLDITSLVASGFDFDGAADQALLHVGGDTNSPYRVVSSNGKVLNVEPEFSAAAQAGDSPVTGRCVIIQTRNDEEMTVRVRTDKPGEAFGFDVKRRYSRRGTRELLTSVKDLVLVASSSNTRVWNAAMVREPVVQAWHLISASFGSGSFTSNDDRDFPANFCAPITFVSQTTGEVRFQWWRSSADSTNAGAGYFRGVAPVDSTVVEQGRYRIVYNDPATNFKVYWHNRRDGTGSSTDDWAGGQLLTSTASPGTEFDPGLVGMSKFTFIAGTSAPEAGDEFYLNIDPIPADILERKPAFYKNAHSGQGNTALAWDVTAASYRSVFVGQRQLENDQSDDFIQIGEPGVATGSIDLTSVTWATTTTLIFQLESSGATTFTASGNKVGAAAILAHLQALDTGNKFTFALDADNHLTVQGREGFGSLSKITIGAGTANSTIGFNATDVFEGTDAHVARLGFDQPLAYGRNGGNFTTDRVKTAFAVEGSAAKILSTVNLGLVRFAVPGLYDGGAKDACALFAASMGFMFSEESGVDAEDGTAPEAAAAMVVAAVAQRESSDFVERYWPDRGYYDDETGTGLVKRSIHGHIFGRRAKLANETSDGERGLHVAAANNNRQGRLSPRLRALINLPFGDIRSAVLDKSLLNENGIVPVLQDGRDIFLMGNAMKSVGRNADGSLFRITDRAVAYHIARDAFVNLRPFIFTSLSTKRMADIATSVRGMMKAYWKDGWFDDQDGTGFDDQVSVTLPEATNTKERIRNEKRIGLGIAFAPRGAIEYIDVVVMPTGVDVQG